MSEKIKVDYKVKSTWIMMKIAYKILNYAKKARKKKKINNNTKKEIFKT